MSLVPTAVRDWLDHPLVRHVSEKVPPGEVLGLLDALHAHLTVIDEKFPGLTMQQVLDTSDPDNELFEIAARYDSIKAMMTGEGFKYDRAKRVFSLRRQPSGLDVDMHRMLTLGESACGIARRLCVKHDTVTWGSRRVRYHARGVGA